MPSRLAHVLASDDTLLTPSEAGRILSVTPEAVRAMHRTGRLSALRTLGGRRLFLRSEVERLATERARKGRP